MNRKHGRSGAFGESVHPDLVGLRRASRAGEDPEFWPGFGNTNLGPRCNERRIPRQQNSC